MDFRTITALWLTFLSFTLSVEATPQRDRNALQPQPTFSEKPSPTTAPGQQGDNSKHSKIMKQINKVNEDGSYTFGYEADDGSFRVETRSKDGVVKGKYGYVDANGELKVMEYTAGEKTGNEDVPSAEEDDQVPTQQPQPQTQTLRYLSRQSKATPSIVLPPQLLQSRSDQASSAQTTSGNSISPPSGEDEEGQGDKSEQDDEDEGHTQKTDVDVNNGQYFRAITQQPTPSVAPTSGPRYVPSHQLGGGPTQSQQPQFNYAPQQGFTTLPQQYTSQGQGSPPQYQGFPQRFGGLQPGQYSPQSLGQSQPLSRPSPYGGQYEEDDGTYSQGLPQGRFPPQFVGGAPQQGGPGRSSPNVQIQFRGSPLDDEVQGQGQARGPPQQYYSQQQEQPGFGPQHQGFSPSRQFESGRPLGGSGQYVPNVDLDGFSEDADEDGYVDEPPNSLSKGGAAAAQEKQGVAIKAVGGGRGQSPGEAYRPQVLGPQGILQGGQVRVGEREQFQPAAGRPPFGSGPPQGQELPQLTDEQIQQLFAQQGGGRQFPPQQGGQPQYLGGGGGQQQFSGFPSQDGPQFQQGFPQSQSPFLGRPGPQSQGRPSQGFLPQQNPLLQGQYVPSSQQGDSEDFAGFPPQFIPQGQPQQGSSGGLPPQYFSQQRPGSSQAQFPQGFQQSGQGGFPAGATGLPPQIQGQGQGQGIQSSGFPFDFNQFGNQGGFQSTPPQFQGFPQQQGQQGFPQQAQGFPQQFQQGQAGPSPAFPSQGGQGLSQQQLAAILQAQQGQGPQGGPQGFSPQIQGFVPGRFPTQGQYLGGGSSGPSSGGSLGAQLQQSPSSSSGGSIQLGGGQPRPVQPASSSTSPGAGGIFGAEERKQLSSSSKSSSGTKSN